MEKSIENIWTKGFTDSKELSIPKITNLYNQKSKLLLEKTKQTYTKDNKSILPMALIFGVCLSIYGHYILGIYGATLMISLYLFNKNLLKSLENIQVTTNSYDYLVSYKESIKKITSSTNKLLVFVLPIVIIIGYWLFIRETEMYLEFINKLSSLQLTLILIGFAILISLIGLLIYKITTKLVYGTYLNKLNSIIDDMDKLKSNN